MPHARSRCDCAALKARGRNPKPVNSRGKPPLSTAARTPRCPPMRARLQKFICSPIFPESRERRHPRADVAGNDAVRPARPSRDGSRRREHEHSFGHIRSDRHSAHPFVDRVSAPRQPYAAEGAKGTIELFPGRDFEHALSDLKPGTTSGWSSGFIPERRLATEGPSSPQHETRGASSPPGRRIVPMRSGCLRCGSSAVRGLVLKVNSVDMVDGTPVLDIKPYLPYADAIPDATAAGWRRRRGPAQSRAVVRGPLDRNSKRATGWLESEHGIDLVTPITRALSLGPEPHP